MKPEQKTTSSGKFLVFRVQKSTFCVDFSWTQGVLAQKVLFPVPASHPRALGIVIHQGQSIPVFCLPFTSGSKPSRKPVDYKKEQTILVMNLPQGEIGFPVDEILTFLPKEEFFPAANSATINGRAEALRHAQEFGGDTIFHLPIEHFLNPGDSHE